MAVAIMAVVVGLAIILTLILILFAELFCSLFLHRQHINFKKSPTENNYSSEQVQISTINGTGPSFFSQGVLHAPRSFLFPAINDDLEKRTPQYSHEKEIPQMFDELPTSSSAQYFQHCPWLVQELSPPPSAGASNRHDDGGSRVYICNPIYDSVNEGFCRVDTPFETPDTSPSRLETENISGRSSSSSSVPATPPLTPMKGLPPEASSISFRVCGGALCATGSDSNSNNEGNSSSSSGSTCTSPSW